MPRKGLSREAIIDTAAALAEQKGAENLTLRELAETLGVKTASLYNHLQGLPELNARLAECALDRLMDTLETAMAGRTGAEGLRALGHRLSYFRPRTAAALPRHGFAAALFRPQLGRTQACLYGPVQPRAGALPPAG